MKKKGNDVKTKVDQSNLENQKIELIKLRIKNKYYDRDEILLKVVQEIYEHSIRKESLN